MKQKLEKLINQQSIMLFMKGNAEKPQCGMKIDCIKVINPFNELNLFRVQPPGHHYTKSNKCQLWHI